MELCFMSTSYTPPAYAHDYLGHIKHDMCPHVIKHPQKMTFGVCVFGLRTVRDHQHPHFSCAHIPPAKPGLPFPVLVRQDVGRFSEEAEELAFSLIARVLFTGAGLRSGLLSRPGVVERRRVSVLAGLPVATLRRGSRITEKDHTASIIVSTLMPIRKFLILKILYRPRTFVWSAIFASLRRACGP